MKLKKLRMTAFAFVALACPGKSQAAFLLSGDFQTGITTPNFTITVDFNLSITSSGDLLALAIDEWAISDGTLTQLSLSPSGQTFAYQINGGSITTVRAGGLVDNISASIGSTTPNDGLLIFNDPIAVTVGQILTVKAQSLTYYRDSYFNPSIPTNFTGAVFAVNADLARLSTNTAVPEPSTWVLIAIGAGLAAVRYRFKKVPVSPDRKAHRS